MKRSAGPALALLALIVLCALAVAAGCDDPGDVEQARTLLKSADAQYETASAPVFEHVDQVEKFFSAYAQGALTDPDEIASRIAEFRRQTAALDAEVEKVKDTYREVRGMPGVPHFKEYARYRTEMLDKLLGIGGVAGKTFAEIERESASGGKPDVNAVESAKRELIGIEMDIAFIEMEALDLAESRKLLK